jgi:hypothetical protein
MKNRILALLACIFAIAPVACHTQVPPVTPPQQSCPVATSAAYTQINPVGSTTNPPTTATTYSDSPSGASCYAVTGYLPPSGGVEGQYGGTSNVVGPQTPGTGAKVNLSLTCTAGAGQTCSGVLWVFSRASAVTALAPATPSANPPTSATETKPFFPQDPNVGCMLDAKNPCIKALASNIPAVTLTASK